LCIFTISGPTSASDAPKPSCCNEKGSNKPQSEIAACNTKSKPHKINGQMSRDYLKRTFEEVGGYDELVVLRDIRVVSFCEHHMLPVIGRAHVGYLPASRVVGISKPARVVQGFARRLQIQEKLTAEIAEAIQDILEPHGVGVVIEAEHSCMTLRGVNTLGATLTTSRLLGVIRDDPRTREEFLRLAHGA